MNSITEELASTFPPVFAYGTTASELNDSLLMGQALQFMREATPTDLLLLGVELPPAESEDFAPCAAIAFTGRVHSFVEVGGVIRVSFFPAAASPTPNGTFRPIGIDEMPVITADTFFTPLDD